MKNQHFVVDSSREPAVGIMYAFFKKYDPNKLQNDLKNFTEFELEFPTIFLFPNKEHQVALALKPEPIIPLIKLNQIFRKNQTLKILYYRENYLHSLLKLIFLNLSFLYSFRQ